jgi:LysR family hydrogen peroxide-inducible transcriptional activator
MNRPAPHPFSLRQLQYVVAVADHASFRRAAEACAVAQPSLSTQIAQLEEALGFRLFERLPRKVVVTAAGAPFLERARRILVEADDARAAAETLRDPLSGAVRIGVIPTVAPYVLPELAPALRRAFPRLQVFWFEEKTGELLARIAAGEREAGLLAAESDLGELSCVPLGRDEFVLAVPKGHRLARSKAALGLDALEGETVLLLEDGHCFRDQALAVCQRAAASEASVRATSLSTLAQMVAGGAGITLLPKIALSIENRARTIVPRALSPRAPHRTLALAFRKSVPSAATLSAIADVMRGVISGKR